MRILPTLVITAAVLCTGGPTFAGKLAGVTLPDTVEVSGKKLVLNGMGLREATMFKVNVYVAGLYLENVSSNPGSIVSSDQTKMIVLKFVRDVDRKDIVEAWNKGFKGNATVKLASIQPQIDRLNSWMSDLDDGDTLVFTYLPGSGVVVEINGQRKGVIDNADFARSLFSIWLGPNPPGSGLKRGMLGRHAGATS
jgi:hypothetical protein